MTRAFLACLDTYLGNRDKIRLIHFPSLLYRTACVKSYFKPVKAILKCHTVGHIFCYKILIAVIQRCHSREGGNPLLQYIISKYMAYLLLLFHN